MTTDQVLKRIEDLEAAVSNLQKQSIRSEISGLSEEAQAVSSGIFSNLPLSTNAGVLLVITDRMDGLLYFDTGVEMRHHNQLYVVSGALPEDVPNGSMAIRTDQLLDGILWIRVRDEWSQFGYNRLSVSTRNFDGPISSDPSIDGENIMTGVTTTPITDPGWLTSSTIDMNEPDGYLKFIVNGIRAAVPFWNAS